MILHKKKIFEQCGELMLSLSQFTLINNKMKSKDFSDVY